MKYFLLLVMVSFVSGASLPARAQEPQSLGAIGIGDANGIRIVEIIPSGPAEAARLIVGDILTAIDGKPVKRITEKSELMTSKMPGSRLLVKYVRQSQSATTTLTVGTVPSGVPPLIARPSDIAAPVQSRTETATASAERPVNLSDNFARAALRALKGIESDASEATFRNGSMMIDRETSELLQDADIEAVSKEEKGALEFLRLFLEIRMADNAVRSTMQSRYEAQLLLSVPDYMIRSRASEAVWKDPRFITMSRRESACSSAIENRLRSRSWNNPSTDECD